MGEFKGKVPLRDHNANAEVERKGKVVEEKTERKDNMVKV